MKDCLIDKGEDDMRDEIEKRIMNESSRDFSCAIRKELESLIEKLAKELEAERNSSVYLKNEILFLQKDLLEAHRNIKLKSEEVYHLQMTQLLKEKE